jgi:hypothetical protein
MTSENRVTNKKLNDQGPLIIDCYSLVIIFQSNLNRVHMKNQIKTSQRRFISKSPST